MKKIIFQQINIKNITLILLFKIFGFKIFYYNISKYLRNEKFVVALKQFNIHWINFNSQENLINPDFGYCQKYFLSNSFL